MESGEWEVESGKWEGACVPQVDPRCRFLCRNPVAQVRRQSQERLVLSQVVDSLQAFDEIPDLLGMLDSRHPIDAVRVEEGLVVQGLAARRAQVEAVLDGRGHEDLVRKPPRRKRLVTCPRLECQRIDGIVGRCRQQRSAEHHQAGLVREARDTLRALAPLVWQLRVRASKRESSIQLTTSSCPIDGQAHQAPERKRAGARTSSRPPS